VREHSNAGSPTAGDVTCGCLNEKSADNNMSQKDSFRYFFGSLL
jgi:hypothetical protein